MQYVPIIIAVAAIALIYLLVRNNNKKKSCGRIACEPIVPVEERDETGAAEGERTVENDTVSGGSAESCDKKE